MIWLGGFFMGIAVGMVLLSLTAHLAVKAEDKAEEKDKNVPVRTL